jgi:diguanylate cyclase (GGDEF)-like protein
MRDQALVWNTDLQLQVTSLSARLRGYAGSGGHDGSLTVNDLWAREDPFAVVVTAHHWALGGECLSFEANLRGMPHRFELQPLENVQGQIVGVTGRAIEIAGTGALDAQAWLHAERFAGMGTWHEDLRTGITTLSEGLATLLGIALAPARFNIRHFDHPDDAAHVAAQLADEGDGDYTCDHRIVCHGSRVRTVRERVRTIQDERGVPVARIGSIIDISDLKEREAELTEIALHDPLTRLPNRAALEERLAASMARCTRTDRRCAVLFIDVDGFKSYNDAYGHAFGDAVLMNVATRLTRHVRGSDTVARYGGDEFVIVIDDLFTEAAALDAARKILHSFDERFEIGSQSVAVSASIGIATYGGGQCTPRELLAAADREMYVVKNNGGSGVKLRPQEDNGAACSEKTECQVHSLADQRRFATLGSA